MKKHLLILTVLLMLIAYYAYAELWSSLEKYVEGCVLIVKCKTEVDGNIVKYKVEETWKGKYSPDLFYKKPPDGYLYADSNHGNTDPTEGREVIFFYTSHNQPYWEKGKLSTHSTAFVVNDGKIIYASTNEWLKKEYTVEDFKKEILQIVGEQEKAEEKKPEAKTKVTIKREDGKVVLESVKNWFVGDKESSMQAAMESIMQALGEDVNYDYLVGVSGLAFRMQVFKKGLCPSSPHPACGFQCFDRSFKSLPWEIKSYEAKAEDTEKVKEIRKLIVESIDKGIPVQYGSEEDGVIIGYQKNGDEWICYHPVKGKDGKSFVETTWPWGIGIYTGKKKEMPDRKSLIIESLQQAVKMAKTEDSGEYYVGFKAWDEYIKELNRIAAGDDKLRADSMLGNAWIYECLVQYRLVAAKYLRDYAGDRDTPISAHLNKAADYYENMASKILADKEHTFCSIAPYSWTLKEGEKWTPEIIKAEIKRLEMALPVERQAIEEIEKALALIKPETKEVPKSSGK